MKKYWKWVFLGGKRLHIKIVWNLILITIYFCVLSLWTGNKYPCVRAYYLCILCEIFTDSLAFLWSTF